jgi:hypothetical protein
VVTVDTLTDPNTGSTLQEGSHLVIQLRERRFPRPRSTVIAEASVSFQIAKQLLSTVAEKCQGLRQVSSCRLPLTKL